MKNIQLNLENLGIGKGRMIRHLTIFIALFAVLFGSAAIVSAQQMVEEPTAADLEQFRADLGALTRELNSISAGMKNVLVTQKAVGQTNAKIPQVTAEMQAQAQKQLQTMSYDELAYLYQVFREKFPEWREAPQVLRNVQKIGIPNTSKGGKGIISMEAITPDDCSVAFNSQPSFIDLYAVKLSEIAAQAAYEAIPEVVNLIALGVWGPLAIGVAYAEYENALFDRCAGDETDAALQASITNISGDIIQRVDTNADFVIDRLTSVGNSIGNSIINNDNSNKTMIVNNDNSNKTMILDAVSSAQTAITNNAGANLTTITTAVTTARTDIINNDNSNRMTIVNNDNSNATTLNTNLTNARNTIIANDNTNTTNIVNNDNTNTTNIVNNDNANKTMIVNNDNANTAALTNLLLRSQIEADLAEESNGVKVAWYLTPTANGGHLDFVQQIVTETLANILAAGGSISNAQSFLDRANSDKAAGNFKAAYDNYKKAYKAAAK